MAKAAAYRARSERGKQPDGLHEIIKQKNDITGEEAQKQFSKLGDEHKTWASTFSVREFRDGPFRVARKQLLNEPLSSRPTGVGSGSVVAKMTTIEENQGTIMVAIDEVHAQGLRRDSRERARGERQDG